jgi:hypothetical protein
MSSTARLLAVVLVLAIPLVAGCGSAASVPGQQAAAGTIAPTGTAAPTAAPTGLPSAPPDARSIPEAFRGVWTASLAAGGQSHGAWKLRITAEDMELLNPRAASDADYFSMNPHAATLDEVTFADDPECAGASYHWTIDGDTLTFAAQGTDPCSDRFDTLTGSAWQRTQ